jgi:hypothetical protein
LCRAGVVSTTCGSGWVDVEHAILILNADD